MRRQRHTYARGRAATENIYGSAADATEAFKQKMTMPEDVVEQKQRAVAAGGKGAGATTATATTTGRSSGGEGEAEDVMLRVKAADQMTGQAFNDVGKMGEEGTGMDGAGARRGH
uniref:Uncharacterized protein n=1 Tax=Oryza brachyantha TaxID=4533 RepID=J3KYR8_ORYBR